MLSYEVVTQYHEVITKLSGSYLMFSFIVFIANHPRKFKIIQKTRGAGGADVAEVVCEADEKKNIFNSKVGKGQIGRV